MKTLGIVVPWEKLAGQYDATPRFGLVEQVGRQMGDSGAQWFVDEMHRKPSDGFRAVHAIGALRGVIMSRGLSESGQEPTNPSIAEWTGIASAYGSLPTSALALAEQVGDRLGDFRAQMFVDTIRRKAAERRDADGDYGALHAVAVTEGVLMAEIHRQSQISQ